MIAAIEGGAFGGGMELALWCDLRIAALAAAIELAQQIAALPQDGLRAARDTAISQWSLSGDQALLAEARRGLAGAALTAPA